MHDNDNASYFKLSDIPLLANSDSYEDLDALYTPRDRRRASNSGGYSYSFIAALIFIVIDLLIFVKVARDLHLREPSTRATKVDQLEFRSPYFGLPDLYEAKNINTTRYGPILNRPRIATQVRRNSPHEVNTEWERQWLSGSGTLSPPDRHLLVSHEPEIHTIVQFRTVDFGMEKCRLGVKLPNAPGTRSANLDVCVLSVPREIEPQQLSWSTRPTCIRPLGSLEAIPGSEILSQEFPCPWSSFHTFEISCGSKCDVDVWSEMNGPLQGVYMYQYQTLGSS